jgi:hypothetical protein
VDYGAMLEDLPCLNVGYRALLDSIDALVVCGLVERITKTYQKSRRSYFRVSQGYYDREAELEKLAEPTPQVQKTSPVIVQKTSPVESEEMQKTSQDRSYLDLKRKTGEGVPPSLIQSLQEEAGERLPTKYKSKETGLTWEQGVKELVSKHGVSLSKLLEVFCWALEHYPGKTLFFPDNYSRYCREINDSEIGASRDEPIRKVRCGNCGKEVVPAGSLCPECRDPVDGSLRRVRELRAQARKPEEEAAIRAIASTVPWRKQRGAVSA